jgi:hypothetical protein
MTPQHRQVELLNELCRPHRIRDSNILRGYHDDCSPHIGGELGNR